MENLENLPEYIDLNGTRLADLTGGWALLVRMYQKKSGIGPQDWP